jgi:hypothetical protein
MARKHRTRYDTLVVPSGPEIKEMYLKEGMSEAQATKKAKEIHDFLNYAVMSEARFWRRVREAERTDGLEPDTPQSKEQRYAVEEGI